MSQLPVASKVLESIESDVAEHSDIVEQEEQAVPVEAVKVPVAVECVKSTVGKIEARSIYPFIWLVLSIWMLFVIIY